MGLPAWMTGGEPETTQEKTPTPVKAGMANRRPETVLSGKPREVIYDPYKRKLVYADTLEDAPEEGETTTHPFF